jgi:Ulp1 family protease
MTIDSYILDNVVNDDISSSVVFLKSYFLQFFEVYYTKKSSTDLENYMLQLKRVSGNIFLKKYICMPVFQVDRNHWYLVIIVDPVCSEEPPACEEQPL